MNNGLFNPNNRRTEYVPASLKTDVRRMNSGNVRSIKNTNAKSTNVRTRTNQEELLRALDKAEDIRRDIFLKLRRGELTDEGLKNMNNKITLLNQHIPKESEVPLANKYDVLGSFKNGGMVKKTGLYQLHKGEKVIPVKDVKKKK